jgi:hypothetical protein
MQYFDVLVGNLTALWRTRPPIVVIYWNVSFNYFASIHLLHQYISAIICKSVYRFY